jgi:uncharacterized hydrophobic protein (TIGR00271 family)
MTLRQHIKRFIRRYIYIYEEMDTLGAAQRIKSGIWFRGPNVWILAFSIIIASVGLNVNSTAVIIGAMLISPLMGPIIGTGLALGTNDVDLLKNAAKNLLVMVLVSLFASTLFFILSPLSLVNPTELEARTSPTIYDVLIALFGGLAGILENSRKERGTVLSGVAIATALMPPLCTAGYGLAHWNMHFFLGALYLFIINSVFIALATYLMVKYLRFPTVAGINAQTAKRRSKLISAILFIVVVPSIWGAFVMIQENNFERNVQTFVENERLVGPRTYVGTYQINGRHKVCFTLSGEPLSDSLKNEFYAHALQYGIHKQDITLTEHTFGMSQQDMDAIVDEIYARTDAELDENDAMVASLQGRMDALEHRIDGLASMNDSLYTANLQLQHKLDSLSAKGSKAGKGKKAK